MKPAGVSDVSLSLPSLLFSYSLVLLSDFFAFLLFRLSLENSLDCQIMWAEAMGKLEGMSSTDRERLWPELVQGFKDLSQRLKVIVVSLKRKDYSNTSVCGFIVDAESVIN